jgi:uridine phosphorylase
LLDMDGDILERLVASGRAHRDPNWPCFHTRFYRWAFDGQEYGVIGGTVGAPFAVLVAEELFAAGCHALVSIASAGLISERLSPPFFVVVDRALRDEGTSHHYLPPGRFALADEALVAAVVETLAGLKPTVIRGASWTTDAPFRETESLVAGRRGEGITCVEMEAAALLAFAAAQGRTVACLAHVTNAMATRTEDFEKGGDGGLEEAALVCGAALRIALARAASARR